MTSKVERAPQVVGPTPWGMVVLLGSLTALGPLAIDMYLPSLPTIGADLRASAAATQATMAAFLAGMAVGQLLYGPASDRIGRRPLILLGVTVFVMASAACALASSIELLVAARFIQAIGATAGAVIGRAVVRDRFDQNETARMLSLMMLIMGLAPVLAPLAGGAMLGVVGWRAIFWVMAAIGAVLGVAAALRLNETRSAETAAHARLEHPIRSYLSLTSSPRLVGYILAAAFNGAALFSYIAASPDLLIRTYGIAPAHFGWVFGTNGIGIVIASQVNGRLLRHRPLDEILARASVAALAAALLLATAAVTGVGGPFSVLPLLFAVLASYSFIQGNAIAGALGVDPRRAGSISALAGGMALTAGAVAAWAVGALHDGTPLPMALVILACLIASALALHGLALKPRPIAGTAQG